MSSVSDTSQPAHAPATTPTDMWRRRCYVVLTVVGLVILAGVLLWLVSLVAVPVCLFLLAALLAYIVYPAVVRLQRHMSRVAAILLVFAGTLVVVLLVAFGVVSTLITQLTELISAIHHGEASGSPAWLQSVGITPARVSTSEQQVTAFLQQLHGKGTSLASNVFVLAVESILVATMVVYFLIYGPLALAWVRRAAPGRWRAAVGLYLDMADQVMGGFLRGIVVLACLMGVLTGAGAYLLGIPFWLLIAVIVFICEFIPVIGAYISGIIGTVLALSQGWQIAAIYLAFATILQGIVDAQVLAPRIIGRHVGVNPIIATFALLAGATLFGVAGAVLAIPIVAVAQMLLIAWWRTYRSAHSEDYPPEPSKEFNSNRAERHANVGAEQAGSFGTLGVESEGLSPR